MPEEITCVNIENGKPVNSTNKLKTQNATATTTTKSCSDINGGRNNGSTAVARASDGGTAGGSGGSVVMLPEHVLDALYHNYSIKQRRSGLKWFFFPAVLFTVWSLIIPLEQSIVTRAISGAALCAYIGLTGMMHIGRNSPNPVLRKFNEQLLGISPHILWAISMIHFTLYIKLQETYSARDVLGWAILLNFLIYVTLPVPLFYVGCIGFWTYFICVVVPLNFTRQDPLVYEMNTANAVLIGTAALIGLLYYFMGEAKQKRAFLEAKKSLEVKMVIEEQSAEQERLLLSVLPKHVAVKMREDLGSSSSEPFKKIYMSRHENVSILYADIVGFTAISSTYSAQDLVKMLNELFARFDRLAEKYQQLRIKILGDCYYCISGAPDERPDHAVLCVHMGLSMVKAIKYVQQKANSPVDMRVGIHTGAVLAGILGQRQWQFDVYSKDVELANKMESSGKAGRVHISDKTLAFLNGEFEVEPAHGERREELLRIAGLKTYFITKVVKPFASPCAKKINETNGVATTASGTAAVSGTNTNNDTDNNTQALDDEELLAESTTETTEVATGEPTTVNNDDDAHNAMDKKEKEENFKQRLEDELVARNGHENLTKDTTLFLKFKNKSLEAAYAAYREPYSSIPLVAALLVQCVDVIYSYIVLPRSALHFINIAAPLIPITMLVLISIAESFPKHLPRCCIDVSKRFNDITFVRELAAIIIALTIGLSNVIDMYFFITYVKTEHIVTESEFNQSNLADDMLASAAVIAAAALTSNEGEQRTSVVLVEDIGGIGNVIDGPVGVSSVIPTVDERVLYPSYLSNFGVLILIAIAVIAQLTHVTKIVLLLAIAALHCYFNIFVLLDLYCFEDKLANNPLIPMRFGTSGLLLVAAVALSFLARHMDHEDRVIFKWKTEVAEQKETANDMRQRNEALVYNVLPVHVAEHFMKNTKRSHDDLYSQSYAEVGVLFASMPNFSDFYSEESVNNQGLECLRFLNEVISDFDALLELPKFQDIIKIKTIGSTYMAASGINVQRNLTADAPITQRWSHLAVLVEFALELKNALQGINEQSFNHFVLKMGINHGPITAGVIGARKPHYDIWGNTVNVASRMESTGKAGAIQVTEETCNILEEFGYTFLQRGLVAVKGKGQLMTYYLQGKSADGKSQRLSKKRSSLELAVPPPSDLNAPTAATPLVAIESTNELEVDIKTPLITLKANDSINHSAAAATSVESTNNSTAGQGIINESQALLD